MAMKPFDYGSAVFSTSLSVFVGLLLKFTVWPTLHPLPFLVGVFGVGFFVWRKDA